MKNYYFRLSLSLLLLLLNSMLVSAHDFEVDGIYYNILSDADKTVEVTYEGSSYTQFSNEYAGNVTIPNTVDYNGSIYNVISVCECAFYGCIELIEIHIPSSITSIGEKAFYGCKNLKTIYNYSSLKFQKGNSAHGNIAEYANVIFTGNEKIQGDYVFRTVSNTNYLVAYIGNETELVLPERYDGWKQYIINEYAFFNCKNLTSVTIPSGVTYIGDYAFFGCWGLTNIVIPNSVTGIGRYAFGSCHGLNSATVSSSVSRIEWGAFSYCSNLIDFKISDGDNPLWIAGGAFTSMPLETLYLGRNINLDQSTPSTAFGKMHKLNTIVIGDCVTNIADNIFYNCKNITTIYFQGYTPPVAGDNSFSNYDATLYVPDGSLTTYQSSSYWSRFKYLVEYYLDKYFYINYVVDGRHYLTDSIKHGHSITLIDIPEKEGYTFSGWSEVPATMPAGDITITGSFSVNYYTLTYMVDGEVYKTEQIAYGDSVVLIDAPVKENYIFSGWSGAPVIMPAEDVIITGSFVYTSVSGVLADTMVKVSSNSITFLGAENSRVVVYSTSGALVEQIDSYTGEEITLERGVYIIRVGNKTLKVKI